MPKELPPTISDNELGEIVVPREDMSEKEKNELKESMRNRVNYLEGLYD